MKVGVVFLLAGFLFVYKFLQVPPGIETDEGVIAHNAALIAKTGRDQNGRFMPVFILSGDRMDWKQPVSVYLSAIFFKLFGASLATFKLVNVTVALASLGLMWVLLKTLFGEKGVVAGLVVLATTPMVVISTRIGTEAIVPLFFASAWLLAIAMYRKNGRIANLIAAAMALGVGFYSYKGMRLIIPPWTLLTIVFLYRKTDKNWLRFVREAAVFGACLFPFLAMTPLLELKYSGAVFERANIAVESYRHYIYYWLSNLDLGFLFLKGDVGRVFSVELFGMFLLGTLPFFLLGIKKAVEKVSFFTYVLVTYLSTPVLFGLAGSMGYGHRLLVLVPSFVIITTLGINAMKVRWRVFFGLFAIINFFNFFTYYFYRYPQAHETREAFSNNLDGSYRILASTAKKQNLTPFVQDNLHSRHGEGNLFFEAAYFDQPLSLWKPGATLPPGSLLLTTMEVVEGMRKFPADAWPVYIQEFR